MKSFLSVLSVLSVLCFSSGCSSLEVHSDWDQSTDFSKLKTYSWTTATQPDTGNPQVDDDLFDDRVRRAVDQQLVSRGYQKTSAGTPDFTVDYQITVKDQTDVDSMPGPYGGWWGGGGQVFTVHYQVGTLILNIRSTATKKLVWRGTASDFVEPSKTPEKRDERIERGVNTLLASFPPGVPAKSGK